MIVSTATKEELIKTLAPIVLAHSYQEGWPTNLLVEEIKSVVNKICFSFLEDDES
jgi:hypothetical protein